LKRGDDTEPGALAVQTIQTRVLLAAGVVLNYMVGPDDSRWAMQARPAPRGRPADAARRSARTPRPVAPARSCTRLGDDVGAMIDAFARGIF
jgi:hypothetical protein